MQKYSIGIVTYINRFEKYFEPLVRQLEKVFPDVEKNYVLNGFYDPGLQQEYLKKAKAFLAKTSANKVITYDEHQALSKCWNRLIISSSNPKILILNDDIRINRLFRICLDLQANFYETVIINRSWSHFLISKSTIKKVGWFDERFVGVGSEDADYALRWALSEGKTVMDKKYQKNIFCLGLKNIVAKNDNPGWKKISGNVFGKYAQINLDFFHQKWDVSQVPQAGYIYAFKSDYFKLKSGMETPEFYSLNI